MRISDASRADLHQSRITFGKSAWSQALGKGRAPIQALAVRHDSRRYSDQAPCNRPLLRAETTRWSWSGAPDGFKLVWACSVGCGH